MWERLSSQPWSEVSGVSWSNRVRSRRLQLTAWPVDARPTEHSRLKGLVEKVRMAVYWMAMEANTSSTMDFQEHCMVAGQMHQKATALSARQGVKDRKTQGEQKTYLGFLFSLLFWITLKTLINISSFQQQKAALHSEKAHNKPTAYYLPSTK